MLTGWIIRNIWSKVYILYIGSGAIEAAHRTVVQKRMKLSGQRWSEKAAFLSRQWNKIINIIIKPKKSSLGEFVIDPF